MLKITKAATPKTYAVMERAAKVGEWGDGSIIQMLVDLFEQFLPMIMGCFALAPKARFVRSCNHPTAGQRARLRELCQEYVPSVPAIPEERWDIACETIPIGIWEALKTTTNRDLRDVFDELVAQMNNAA